MRRILCHKYEVLRPIAEGGMGSVYLVKDLHLNKLAAVKVNAGPVEGEAEMLKTLSHPALPRILDIFYEGEKECIVMEYVEGITLEQYLRRFVRVEVAKAVAWAAELAGVLAYLHSRKPAVIYKDLKPANIMIDAEGKLKLIDFGTAGGLRYGQEREHYLCGTPGYGAPEQWDTTGACKESDVYALGAVLHEMLTGISPLGGMRQRRGIREYDKSFPRELEKIITTCTRKKPSERYHSMEEVRNELLHYHKKGKLQKMIHLIKRLLGSGLWILFLATTVLPFLEGVSEQSLPFPYFEKPLFLFAFALIFHFIFLRERDKKRMVYKQEKSVFLTEKKFAGLFVTLWAGICLFGIMMIKAPAAANVMAAGQSCSLWVEMRDEQYRKLLLREGAVYRVDKKLTFEIDKEDLPEGVISVQIVASDKEKGVYESRVFLVEKN